ncbi:MAG: hypothetical protein ACTS6P_01325 [Candidatus Hodgkinia cicadicola]
MNLRITRERIKPKQLPRSSEVLCKFVAVALAQQTLNNIGVEVASKLIAQFAKWTSVVIQSWENGWMLRNLTDVITSDSEVTYLKVNSTSLRNVLQRRSNI